ncbi:hypothetical protein ACFZBU_10790 [Embleya sp. NPDC008237]|uniref:hypothetical protein n=1 Tax=Embleya sp. NPDC008237 TaxID=3363978 RepID=UPI0036E98A85
MTALTNLLCLVGAFAVIGLMSLLPMLFIETPKEWCRTCKHQRSDHQGGNGTCSGDEFPVGEIISGGTCDCSTDVPNKQPR